MRTLVWLLAAGLLAILGIIISQQGALDPLRNLALTISSPFQRGLRTAAEPVADYLDSLVDRQNLEDENRALRQQIEELTTEIARLKENEFLAEELAELAQVEESRPDDDFLVAKVIARDPSNVRDRVAIDRGSGDGITEGMVIVSKGGSLVGVVSKVLDSFSWVTLISDPNSNVNALIQDSRTEGVVSGGLHDGLSMDLIPQDAEVEPGNIVTTSGLGGNFPEGLVIGRLTSVRGEDQDVFQKADIEPAANLSRLENVLVLTSFTPAYLSP